MRSVPGQRRLLLARSRICTAVAFTLFQFTGRACSEPRVTLPPPPSLPGAIVAAEGPEGGRVVGRHSPVLQLQGWLDSRGLPPCRRGSGLQRCLGTGLTQVGV